jgi:exopolysaccharide production protein ExoZ
MLNNIQVLRALAALMVAFAHLAVLNPGLRFIEVGTLGVEVFFVISGFVMVYITRSRETRPTEFMLNRIMRIAPLYWLLTIGVFSLALIMPALLGATQAEPVDLIKSLFFIPYVKQSGLMQPVLFLGWTLNYEMFFYLLFSVSLLVPDMRLRVAGLVAGLALLVGFGVFLAPQAPMARFYTSPIMLDFCYGMVLGLRYPRLGSRALLGVAALFVGVLGLSLAMHTANLGNTYLRGAFALVVVTLALHSQALDRTVTWKPALLLGAASYSLYLIHPFAFIPIEKVAARMDLLEGAPLFGVLILSIAAVVCAGIALHLWIELPLQRITRHMLKGPAPVPRGTSDTG